MVLVKRKTVFLKLKLLMGFIICLFMTLFLNSIVFASIPYTYSFVENGDNDNRDIKVEFDDYEVTNFVADIEKGEYIYIEPVPEEAFVSFDLKAEASINSNNLIVEIEGLDPRVVDYQLVIRSGALIISGGYNQVTTFRLPFSYHDIMPGFKTTFVESGKNEINEIFKNNAPRDIYLNVPHLYFDQIRTVHRWQEDLPPEDYRSELYNALPNLTNIDIWTKPQVARVDVGTKDNEDYNRRLPRHRDDLFTTGYAGLEAELTTSSSISNLHNPSVDTDDITIKAYDEYGRKLGERFFRLGVRDTEDDFIIDDYIDRSNVPDVFGKQYTLLELMEDEILLETILSKMSVDDLDKIGVRYMSIKGLIDVGNDANLLARAIADVVDEIIRLDGMIELDANLLIKDNIRIVGAPGSSINFNDEDGKMILTTSSSIYVNVTLSGITIDGDLDIDVGEDGKVYLKDVNVTGVTNVSSGGIETIVLNDFTTDKLVVNSSSEVRIVFEGRFSGDVFVKNEEKVVFNNKTDENIKIYIEPDKQTNQNDGEIELEPEKGVSVKRALEIKSITDGAISVGGISLGGIDFDDTDFETYDIYELKNGEWEKASITEGGIEIENGEFYSFRVVIKDDEDHPLYSNEVILNPLRENEFSIENGEHITTDSAIEFEFPEGLGLEAGDIVFVQKNVSDSAIAKVSGDDGDNIVFGGEENSLEDGKASVNFVERVQGELYKFRIIIKDEKHERVGYSKWSEEFGVPEED